MSLEGDEKMPFNERLKEARIAAGYTQEQVAEKIGIAKSTLAGYEIGSREPSIPTVEKIMKVLSVDANFLYQDGIDNSSMSYFSPEEQDHIKKYRSLDSLDKKAVDGLLDTLSNRRSEQSKEFIQLEPPLLYPYYGHIASAGTGQFVFDDIPPEMIEVENNHINMQADFAVGVNGDSMEPTYSDGDVLLIKKQHSLNKGDIGIFMIDGEAFVKEYDGDVLKSHNKAYPDILVSENTVCLGKVIGKHI